MLTFTQLMHKQIKFWLCFRYLKSPFNLKQSMQLMVNVLNPTVTDGLVTKYKKSLELNNILWAIKTEAQQNFIVIYP